MDALTKSGDGLVRMVRYGDKENRLDLRFNPPHVPGGFDRAQGRIGCPERQTDAVDDVPGAAKRDGDERTHVAGILSAFARGFGAILGAVRV
jgi:hypothetical protein